MSLKLRRLVLVLVVMAVGFAGLPTHADALPAAHDQLQQTGAQGEHRSDHGHHGDAADTECKQVGHCSAIQLLPATNADAPHAPGNDAWSIPRDVHAGSLKPEASTPPPRSA